MNKTPWLTRTAAVLSVLGVLGLASCGFPYDDAELRDINDAFGDTLQAEETPTESATEAADATNTETDTETETQATSEPSNSSQSITVDGRKRTYSVTVPPEASEGTRLPLIFAFHGKDETSDVLRDYSNLDRARAYVVYMDGIDKAWAPAPYATTTSEEDLTFVDEVRKKMIAEFNIDTARVFATGLSNGGGFAAYVGCQRPTGFTAVSTVSAAYYWKVSDNCSVIPMKLLDIHGTNDSVISYEGGSRHDTAYSSIPQILDDAARRNHCTDEVTISQLGSNGVKQKWDDCDAPLEHIRIGTGTHTWPGGERDPNENAPKDIGTEQILQFFGVSMRGK